MYGGLSEYNLYVKENSKKLRELYPGLYNGDLFKVIANLYRSGKTLYTISEIELLRGVNKEKILEKKNINKKSNEEINEILDLITEEYFILKDRINNIENEIKNVHLIEDLALELEDLRNDIQNIYYIIEINNKNQINSLNNIIVEALKYFEILLDSINDINERLSLIEKTAITSPILGEDFFKDITRPTEEFEIPEYEYQVKSLI